MPFNQSASSNFVMLIINNVNASLSIKPIAGLYLNVYCFILSVGLKVYAIKRNLPVSTSGNMHKIDHQACHV